ncbi:hypothetical protein MMC26_006867 [Xylographa opegraphella]|nr:hypothetical protein [Xylographa opegraphella]
MVPAPERDPNGMPIVYEEYNLDRDILLEALTDVSDYIHSHNKHITIVAIGGAVNVMMLKSRKFTHDIDFFIADSTNEDAEMLRDAAKQATLRTKVKLGGNWLNNSVALMIPRALRAELVLEAIEQNDVLHRGYGLTVIAAPWKYALCMKLNRIAAHKDKLHDPKDAARYFREHIIREGLNQVTVKTIQEWATYYTTQAPVEAIRKMDISYYTVFMEHGVLLEHD